MSTATDQFSGPDTLGADFVAEARRQLESSVGLIRHAVGQLDDDQVWWRPHEGMNSIGNLLLHLAGNLRQRFHAIIKGAPDDRDRFGEFTERHPYPRAELLRRFDESAAQADAILAGLTPEQLAQPRRFEVLSGPTEQPVLGVALQALTHLSGHAQEILHLARCQLGDRYVFRSPAGVPPRPGGQR